MPLIEVDTLSKSQMTPPENTSLLVQKLLYKADASQRIAIVEDGYSWTVSELRQNSFRLASALRERGISEGDRVALLFLNQKEYLAGFFAVLHIGAVIVPVNSSIPPEDIAYVLKDSGCKLILTDGAFAPLVEKLPWPVLMAHSTDETRFPSLEKAMAEGQEDCPGYPPSDAKSMRILMYTSGTTGKPKGVMLSEQNLLANMEGVRPVLLLQPDERMLLALPLFHAYGQVIALYALECDVTMYLVPNFSPKKIIQVLIEQEIAVLPLVPTLFSVLMASVAKLGPEPFKNLKYCVSGGAALPAKLLHHIQDTLQLTVLEGYGLTETAPVLAVNARETGAVPLSVGQPLPNLEIKLVDEDGNRLPVSTGTESDEGEILARGPNVMLGYYNLPEATVEAFDSEGYFRTGDLGRFDAQGRLFISGGRKKDLIIKSGENISPMRIEHAIQEHLAVRDVAVIGMPNEKLGEEVVACVVLAPEAAGKVSEGELRKFCQERLSPLMIPAAIHFYDELPKNAAGKILKPQLKAELLKAES
jgi:long-chain acyl-CoA synthetase